MIDQAGDLGHRTLAGAVAAHRTAWRARWSALEGHHRALAKEIEAEPARGRELYAAFLSTRRWLRRFLRRRFGARLCYPPAAALPPGRPRSPWGGVSLRLVDPTRSLSEDEHVSLLWLFWSWLFFDGVVAEADVVYAAARQAGLDDTAARSRAALALLPALRDQALVLTAKLMLALELPDEGRAALALSLSGALMTQLSLGRSRRLRLAIATLADAPAGRAGDALARVLPSTVLAAWSALAADHLAGGAVSDVPKGTLAQQVTALRRAVAAALAAEGPGISAKACVSVGGTGAAWDALLAGDSHAAAWATSDTPETVFVRGLELRRLQEVLRGARLSPRERRVLLFRAAGLTEGEIAGADARTIGQVRQELGRARAKMRRHLATSP